MHQKILQYPLSSCTPYNIMISDIYNLDDVLANNNDKVNLFDDYFSSDFDSHSVMPYPLCITQCYYTNCLC